MSSNSCSSTLLLHVFCTCLPAAPCQVPYKVLNFLTSYINYGGRVTDDKDLRTIDVILKDYFCPSIMVDGYKFSASGLYHTCVFRVRWRALHVTAWGVLLE